VPEAHLDACHLAWGDKVKHGSERSITLGDAA
jgi:hypothetical protein